MSERDPATNQLINYREKVKDKFPVIVGTTSSGSPLINKDRSMTVGNRGPIPLSDVQFIEEVAHFVRERIPERVLHAKGSGALGKFITTNPNIGQLTYAKVFHPGKETDVIVRFSTTVGELGSRETTRDMKGMSVKFKTEDGIFDLIGNHLPTYFLRDPILFPSLVHAIKRNPRTNLHDPIMFWDFLSKRPETLNTVLRMFSDDGIPDGWRRMNSYPTNVYKLVNSLNQVHYCKFIWQCEQRRNLTPEMADKVEPDYYTRDLYNAIEKRSFPKWNLLVQAMNEAQVSMLLNRPRNPFDPFDNTKEWPEAEFRPQLIGTLTLFANPENHFAEIEQLAFSPSNMVPGIEASAYDKIFQGRMFAYPDAQRYRLGPNYQQLPYNHSLLQVRNYQRDGPNTVFHQGEQPNYHPNSFAGPADLLTDRDNYTADIFKGVSNIVYDDYWQCREYWLKSPGQTRLARNLATSISMVTDAQIRLKVYEELKKIDFSLYDRVKRLIED